MGKGDFRCNIWYCLELFVKCIWYELRELGHLLLFHFQSQSFPSLKTWNVSIAKTVSLKPLINVFGQIWWQVFQQSQEERQILRKGVEDKAGNCFASGGWGWNWWLPKIQAETSSSFCSEPTSAHTSLSLQMARRLKREHSCLNLCKRKESLLPPWKCIRTSCNSSISTKFKKFGWIFSPSKLC